MSYNRKIVGFERNGAYLHGRAMKNLRENNPLDALDLLRGALAQEPDKREYRLDLAELYSRLGRHELSSALILDMLSEGDEGSECYLALSVERFGRGDVEGAKRALDIYRVKAGDEAYFDCMDAFEEGMADRLLGELRDDDRRVERARKICARAVEALGQGRSEAMLRLLEDADARGLLLDNDRVYYALALKLAGEDARAREQLSAMPPVDDVRRLCVLAQLEQLLGRTEAADETIRRMIEGRPEDADRIFLIYTLIKMERYEAASKLAAEALRAAPYDAPLLHMNAVFRLRAGDAAQAAAYWGRILRIHPGDSVAAYYAQGLREGTLDAGDLPFTCDVPIMEKLERLERMTKRLECDMDGAIAAWREEESFRSIVLWMTELPESYCVRAAALLLALAGDARADSALRVLMDRHDVDAETKAHVLALYKGRGGTAANILPPDADEADGILPASAEILRALPACERQLVRFASEVLEDDFKICALPALAANWSAYRRRSMRAGRHEVLLSTQEAAAALVWNYLLEHGKHVRPSKLAKSFDCKQRRMIYYARHMAGIPAGDDERETV